MMRLAGIFALFLVVTSPSWAAGLSCSAVDCMDRINRAISANSPQLVAAKDRCVVEQGQERCRFQSRSGPGINFISKAGSAAVQTILIVDAGGLSANGAMYLLTMMEVFDRSLDEKRRQSLFNQMIGEFARVETKGGTIQKSSGALKYVLSSTDNVSIVALTGAK